MWPMLDPRNVVMMGVLLTLSCLPAMSGCDSTTDDPDIEASGDILDSESLDFLPLDVTGGDHRSAHGDQIGADGGDIHVGDGLVDAADAAGLPEEFDLPCVGKGTDSQGTSILIPLAGRPCALASRCLVADDEAVVASGDNSKGVCQYFQGDPQRLFCLPVVDNSEAWDEACWDADTSDEAACIPDGAYVPGPCQNRRCGEARDVVNLDKDTPCDTGNPCLQPGQKCDGLGMCRGLEVTPSSTPCHQTHCEVVDGQATLVTEVDNTNVEDDGSVCTMDTCQQGMPLHIPFLCLPDPSDGPCTVRSCQNVGGKATCVVQTKSDGESCSDGMGCTTGDACNAGQCTGQVVDCGGPVGEGCPDQQCEPLGTDDYRCFTPTTDPETGEPICLPNGHPAAPNRCAHVDETVNDGCLRCNAQGLWVEGDSCNDGEACTIGDKCYYGVCTHTIDWLDVIAILPCQQLDCSSSGTPGVVTKPGYCIYNGTCLALNEKPQFEDCRQCQVPAGAPAGTAPAVLALTGGLCEDTNPLSPTGQCISGVCEIIQVQCQQNLTCALYSPADNCTTPVRSDEGMCLLKHPTSGLWGCYGLGTPHPTSGCLVCAIGADGTASFQANQGAACSLNNSCVESAACNAAGECAATASKQCDDNPCAQSGFCVPGVGCVYNSKPDFAVCNTACGKGICLAGKCSMTCDCDPAECEDGNPCTAHSCDPVTGCVDTPANEGGACDTGNPCQSDGQCFHGACLGQQVQCNDGNPCTLDTCDPALGCVYSDAEGLLCTDDNVCTVGDQCLAGACAPGPFDPCDDGNQCTFDFCDPSLGCKHLDNPAPTGAVQCWEYACNPTDGSFELVPQAAGASCDDGSSCTVLDQCQQGDCIGLGLCNRGVSVNGSQVVTLPYITLQGNEATLAWLVNLTTFGSSGPVVIGEAVSLDGQVVIRFMVAGNSDNPMQVVPGEFLVSYTSAGVTTLFTTQAVIQQAKWTQLSLGFSGDTVQTVSTGNAQKKSGLVQLQGPSTLPIGFWFAGQPFVWTLGGKSVSSGMGVNSVGKYSSFSIWSLNLETGVPKYVHPNLWCLYTAEIENEYQDMDSVVGLWLFNELAGQQVYDASQKQADGCLGLTCETDAADATRGGWAESFRAACGPVE